MLTLADADEWALPDGPETVTAGGEEAGGAGVVVSAAAGGTAGSGAVVVVAVVGVAVVVVGSVAVVLAVVVVPVSCAADTAGTAQIAARTSIPLARALAPFIHPILRASRER
jgi:hypothetical protein